MKTIKILSLLIAGLFLTVSCDEEETASPLCIAGPCGTIDNTQFNIAILNPSQIEISNVEYNLNGIAVTIPSKGMDFENQVYYSCWFSTDLKITPSSTSSITYELDGKTVTYTLEGVGIQTNAMIIEIKEGQVSNYDYDKECNDTPNG